MRAAAEAEASYVAAYAPEVSEPWLSAQRALEEWSTLMQTTPIEQWEHLCHDGASKLSMAARKLPANSVESTAEDIEARGDTASLPQGEAKHLRALLEALEPAWRCEAILAPTPLNQFSAFMAAVCKAETAATFLADALEEAPNWRTASDARWSMAQGFERVVKLLQRISLVVQKSCTGDEEPSELEAFLSHSQFLVDVGTMISRTSALMQATIGVTHPLFNVAARAGTAATELIDEGTQLQERLEKFSRWHQDEEQNEQTELVRSMPSASAALMERCTAARRGEKWAPSLEEEDRQSARSQRLLQARTRSKQAAEAEAKAASDAATAAAAAAADAKAAAVAPPSRPAAQTPMPASAATGSSRTPTTATAAVSRQPQAIAAGSHLDAPKASALESAQPADPVVAPTPSEKSSRRTPPSAGGASVARPSVDRGASSKTPIAPGANQATSVRQPAGTPAAAASATTTAPSQPVQAKAPQQQPQQQPASMQSTSPSDQSRSQSGGEQPGKASSPAEPTAAKASAATVPTAKTKAKAKATAGTTPRLESSEEEAQETSDTTTTG